MVARIAPSDSPQVLQKLSLLRPRFLYLRAEVKEIPIPILLFIPLSLLELAPALATSILRREGHRPGTEYALQALKAVQGQTWELRKLPPFTLVEAEVRGQVRAKIGIW
jgi:hypothetical protein